MAKSRSLNIVRKLFPQVNKVKDAIQSLSVQVTDEDGNSAEVKDHQGCAMAVACRRSTHADGVIISVGSAFVIKGDTAVRYRVPESVAREVVSFDRNAGFAPGTYELKKIMPCQRLGRRRIDKSTEGTGKPHPHKRGPFRHKTGGIRAVLS